jgi:aromatic-L-amino-acid/L-tryptophan decarboxylase
MAVLAHPDDETLGFGGILARYADEGVETSVITATRGQSGRYRGHAQGTPEHPGMDALASIREAELRAATQTLGVSDLTVLDYHDQMLDRADAQDAIRKIVAHIRRLRPQVVVTFAPDGSYGHPDHIAISQMATSATVAAADPGFDAGGDSAHTVSKMYYLAWPSSTWAVYEKAFRRLVSRVDGVDRQATPWPDWALTTVIDTRRWWPTVWKAVVCHESQVTAYAKLQEVSKGDHEALWGRQSFYRAMSLVNGGREQETDLFAGLRDTRNVTSDATVPPARTSGAAAPAFTRAGRRDAPLAMDATAFRTHGHALVDQLSDLLASVPGRPITPNGTPSAVRRGLDLDRGLPEEGTAPGELLERAARQLFDHSLFNAHPRFFGYITAPPAPIGILGDLMAAALNPNVGAWTLSPAASEVEAQTIRWIAELIGFPTNSGGLFVSGGNMANIVCFLAARAAKAPWNIREQGTGGPTGRRLIAYGSAETHTWVQKAADIAGLGTSAVRWIPTDASLRMDVGALRAQIESDLRDGALPFMVVGTAGSVSTGAIDPLPEIADLCREQGLWFHVDGAYGGFAAAVPGASADLLALSGADSVAVDPHKWLYAPLEAGCALVRDGEHLRAAFAYHPAYYHFEEAAVNYVDHGPQNSRGFRALKVWLALQHVGASGYRRMIGDDIELSRALAAAVDQHGELQLETQSLSIATFRFVPSDLAERTAEPKVSAYLDGLNERLLDVLQRGGEAFVSNAVVGGRYLLRACIVNFHTSQSDVDALPDIVAKTGRTLDALSRPGPLGTREL